MKCIVCQKTEIIKHPQWGFLPCDTCKTKTRLEGLPTEFVPQSVKDSRKKYAKDILQSSRDGVLSQERLDAWGTKGIKVTPEQVKNARYVWGGTPGFPYTESNGKNI